LAWRRHARRILAAEHGRNEGLAAARGGAL